MCWESATVYQHTSRKTDAQHVVARACVHGYNGLPDTLSADPPGPELAPGTFPPLFPISGACLQEAQHDRDPNCIPILRHEEGCTMQP